MIIKGMRMARIHLDSASHRITDSLQRHRTILILALVLNIGDVVTTQIGFARGIPEGNPVPAMLHASGGELAIFGAKFAVMAGVALLICLLDRRFPRLWHTFTVINIVLLAVVLSNSAQVLAH